MLVILFQYFFHQPYSHDFYIKTFFTLLSNIIKCNNAHVHWAEHGYNNQLRRCNCRNPDHCPLNGECLTSSIVYEATVATDNTPLTKKCIGSTETPFKQRLVNHKMSFRHERYENSTELSKHVCVTEREHSCVHKGIA